MNKIITFLFLLMAGTILAAPPPPIVRNTYTTNYCTDLLVNCRGIIIANNNTSIVVNSQWNTVDNANISANISGGFGNNIMAGNDQAVIGGGTGNTIRPNTLASVIGGGSGNIVSDNAVYSVICGGLVNLISSAATQSAIVGGQGNSITYTLGADSLSFIGGGLLNTIDDYPLNVIVGGSGHTIAKGSSSFIGGGTDNGIDSLGGANTISGGNDNTISIQDAMGGYATIGGGRINTANSNYCTVAGGYENINLSLASTIGGGGHNTIQYLADHGTIAGGSLNSISNGSYSVIGGGSTNSITNGFASTISGGYDNHISSLYSTISGGFSNKIWGADSAYGFIGGGHFNEIRVNDSVIGGGFGNYISDANSGYVTISGGYYNYTLGNFTSIIGGRENTNASGDYSTILGGYSNRTEGAMAVVGGRSGCAIGDGTWFFKDNSSGRRSNNVANSFETYFTGGDNKLGVLNVTMTGTNRNLQGTRSDGVISPLIGLLSDTNRIRSSGANFGVIFNNSSDTFLTRMDNNGNWGFKTNIPQRIIHINGTGTNYAPIWLSQVNTNPPGVGATVKRHLNIILDDGQQYTIHLYQ